MEKLQTRIARESMPGSTTHVEVALADFVGGAYVIPDTADSLNFAPLAGTLTATLPSAAGCRGKIVSFTGTFSTTGTLTVSSDGTTVVAFSQVVTPFAQWAFSNGKQWLLGRGVDGSDGADGVDGLDGTDAPQWTTGSGAPSDGDGNNGDWYLRTGATGGIYLKATDTWGLIASLGDITVT